MPFVVLNAADEKNQKGSTIPLLHDSENDLNIGLHQTLAIRIVCRNRHQTMLMNERRADRRTPPTRMISSEKALSAVFANKAFRVERRGVEPPTSALRTQESRVPSGNLSDVAATDSGACTAACTSKPPNRRKRGADAAAVEGVETPAEVRAAKPVETDFAAALKMLAVLPLSDEERAEAVRRLLKGNGGAGG